MLTRIRNFVEKRAQIKRDGETYDPYQFSRYSVVGDYTNSNDSGFLEMAAVLYARCFAVASISQPLIDNRQLGQIARDCVRRGESVWGVEIDRELGLMLVPASSWNIQGTYDERTWRYELTLSGPSQSVTKVFPSEAVLHFRWTHDSRHTWRGKPAHEVAYSAAKLATESERTLGEEASKPVGTMLVHNSLTPRSTDGHKAIADQISPAVNAMKGRATLIQLDGRSGSDVLKVERLQPAPTPSSVDLYAKSLDSVLDLYGIPSGLLGAREGAAQRESWRRFVVSSVEPFARNIEHELHRKLDRDIKLSFDSLRAFDYTNLARAVASLVKAGLSTEEAIEKVFIEEHQ